MDKDLELIFALPLRCLQEITCFDRCLSPASPSNSQLDFTLLRDTHGLDSHRMQSPLLNREIHDLPLLRYLLCGLL
jgi:hypothetical protein